YEWAELAPHLRAEALRIGVVDDAEQLCAAILLLITHAPVLRKTYFYAARGPIIDDPDSPAMDILLDYILAEAHKRGAFMLKIEPSVPDGNDQWLEALRKRGFQPNPYAVHVRHEWVLDLRPDEKEILVGMKEKWRYNVRLAGRKGVIVRRGKGQADLDTFYHIYHGIPDVLEEGQELWGVYLFKRGFGGYALRFLETHDLVYKPLIYKLYMRLLEMKRKRDERERRRGGTRNKGGASPAPTIY